MLSFRLYNNAFNLDYLLFAFGGTMASYNFHWFLSHHKDPAKPRGNWSLESRNLHIVLFITGILIAAFAFFRLWHWWGWLVSTAFFTFLYSAPMIPHPFFRSLKKVAIAKTAFLAFAWTHITVNLPLIFTVSDWERSHYLFSLNRFFFIFSICILFDYRDRESDAREGIRSMVTQLDERGVDILFWCSQILVLITSISLSGTDLLFFSILIFPSIILALRYSVYKKSTSDYTYYFILDGLMAASAVFILLLDGSGRFFL
jgi:4-hydroxybenzoate polyprenyltransferase